MIICVIKIVFNSGFFFFPEFVLLRKHSVLLQGKLVLLVLIFWQPERTKLQCVETEE